MATIISRPGPSGRTTYRVQIRRKGYPTLSATFPTRSEAKKWAQATEDDIRSGKQVASSRQHTLAEAIDRYIEEVLPHKRPSTIPGQTRHLLWWRKRLGYALLGDVTPAKVAEGRDALVKQSSNSTANRYLAALSHTFTISIKEWGWASDNPCLKVRRMREPKGRVRFLSDEERHRLLAECRVSRSPRLYPLVVLALSTGARRGELLGLRWEDVDLDLGSLTFQETKNGSRRSVPLLGHALGLVAALPRTHDLVFPGDTKDRRANIQQCWKLAVARAELVGFRFHDLRHSAASYLAQSGVSLIEIGALLGHRSPAMTYRYAHLSPGHLASLATRLDAKLFS